MPPMQCVVFLNCFALKDYHDQPIDSAAVSIFVVILVELTNTVFVNSTNITTNIKTAVLSNTRLEKSGGIVLKAKFRSFQCHPQRSR